MKFAWNFRVNLYLIPYIRIINGALSHAAMLLAEKQTCFRGRIAAILFGFSEKSDTDLCRQSKFPPLAAWRKCCTMVAHRKASRSDKIGIGISIGRLTFQRDGSRP